MRKLSTSLALASLTAGASAQFQVNPQAGMVFQNITNPGPGIEYKANIGWQLGADLRMGDRFFFQPGAHFGRSSTAYKAINNDTLLFENDLVRTNLRLNALAGYRIIDSYQFDLRFMAGPTYDVLLSVDNRNDRIGYNRGDFRRGSLNLDAALGFDMGVVTVQPGVSFGLSRVFKDNPVVKDITSRYLTYGLTVGVNIGNDD
ncbi:MAG: outer membrane beta-barrel protein [Flavobacteriales bacterium]